MPDISKSKSKRKIIRDLLDSEEKKPRLDNQKSKISLHQAISKGDKETVIEHIENGSDLNLKDNKGWTPLLLALRDVHLEIAAILIKHGASVKSTNKDGVTPLHLAIQLGSMELSKAILERNANINAKDKKGLTPMHYASDSEFDNPDIAQFLINNGANLEDVSHLGTTPLHMAAGKGFVNIARFLLHKGSDINAKDKKGFSALHYASDSTEKQNMVQFLIDNGANLKEVSYLGITPLHLAVDSGLVNIARLLLEKGSDANAKDSKHLGPLHFAIKDVLEENDEQYAKIKDLVSLLINYGAKVDKTALTMAVKKGTPEVCEILFSKLENAKETINKDHSSLLHLALKSRFYKILQILIDYGGDVNSKDKKGFTLLHKALLKDKEAEETEEDITIEILAKNGANLNIKTKSGKTAFDLAFDSGNESAMDILLKHGAIVNKRKKIDMSLHQAVIAGYPGITKHLLSKGADIDVRDTNGCTPLFIAAKEGFKEVASILIRNGASIDAKHAQDWTPIHTAIMKRHYEIVKMLVEAKANVNAIAFTSNRYATPIHFSMFAKEFNVTKLLIENGADINFKMTPHGITPLYYAVYRNFKQLALTFLQYGASTVIRDDNGLTPFELALRKRSFKMFMYAGLE